MEDASSGWSEGKAFPLGIFVGKGKKLSERGSLSEERRARLSWLVLKHVDLGVDRVDTHEDCCDVLQFEGSPEPLLVVFSSVVLAQTKGVRFTRPALILPGSRSDKSVGYFSAGLLLFFFVFHDASKKVGC